MSIVHTPESRTVVKNVHAVHNVKTITAGITALLLPSPRYYRKVSFHPHGITAIFQTITAGFTAVTAVIPLSPLPCHSLFLILSNAACDRHTRSLKFFQISDSLSLSLICRRTVYRKRLSASFMSTRAPRAILETGPTGDESCALWTNIIVGLIC